MVEMNDDVISHIGEYLYHKEIFFASTVNKQWNQTLFYHKQKLCKSILKDVKILHYCNNLCPCILEKHYQNMISEFKLKRYFCSQLNDKEIPPEWLTKYLDDK
jgi:hypothetical protein